MIDLKIGSEYYIRDKGPPELPQRMMARRFGDKRRDAVKEIRGGSRVTLLSKSRVEVKFRFDGQEYVTFTSTFAQFASEHSPKGE